MSLMLRHPWAMTTRFRDVIVLTYAFPHTLLRRLVPRTLEPETRGDLGFVAVALVDMDGLRPSRAPRWTGSDAVFVGYRVFVRTELADGRVRRGLKVIRTDVDRLHLLIGTRLLTRYDTGLVTASWQRDSDQQHVRARSRWRGAPLELDVVLEQPATPPEGSPFASWSEAAPFCGPLPWTFAPDSDSTAVAVKGVRSDWRPQPVTVSSQSIGLFAQPPFSAQRPLLAAAFHVTDVDYSWRAGKQERVRAPQRGSS